MGCGSSILPTAAGEVPTKTVYLDVNGDGKSVSVAASYRLAPTRQTVELVTSVQPVATLLATVCAGIGLPGCDPQLTAVAPTHSSPTFYQTFTESKKQVKESELFCEVDFPKLHHYKLKQCMFTPENLQCVAFLIVCTTSSV